MDKNWNINVLFIIRVNFDIVWAGHYTVTLAGFYQIFVQLTQRLISISPSTTIKVKRLINLQAISTVGKLHKCDQAAALAYKTKTYKNLFCGGFRLDI